MAILAKARVLTLDDWKLAYQIQPGDYIFDHDGNPVKVKTVQTYRADDCYEILFDDYLSISGDRHLRLPVETPKYRKRTYEYKHRFKFRRPLVDLTSDQLTEVPLVDKRQRKRLSVPTAKPLDLPHQFLTIPPFLFGFWFFNRLRHGWLSPPKGKAEYIHQQFKDAGYKITTGRKLPNGERVFKTTPSIESQLRPFIPLKIPANYLMGSVEQRLELLRGIIHSKPRQYNQRTNTFRFSKNNPLFTRQVQFLVESLGCRSSNNSDENVGNSTLLFKCSYKLLEEQITKVVQVHAARRYITEIKPLPSQLCTHIEIEGTNPNFLVGEGFIACR